MEKNRDERLAKSARSLRKTMTKEERHLWYDYLRGLKNLGVFVHRQRVIGPYIVDFYIASEKLVIEVDGSQHYENSGVAHDVIRDRYLQRLGVKVLRYSNLDVNLRFESVCQDIWNHVGKLRERE